MESKKRGFVMHFAFRQKQPSPGEPGRLPIRTLALAVRPWNTSSQYVILSMVLTCSTRTMIAVSESDGS